MKTYETEKNDIPEGATHYMNQTSYSYFAWCRYVDDRLYVTLSGELDWTHVSEDIFGRNIKPIPQTKEVEWVNGEVCIYRGEEWLFVGEMPVKGSKFNAECIIQHKGGAPLPVGFNDISKPETEAERIEREELARKVMITNEMCLSVTSLKPSQAIALYEAGYRKESE